MLPTVGRIVHFYGSAGLAQGRGPHAAIVTRVWGPDMVNLTVLPDGVAPVAIASVCRVDAIDEAAPIACWTWPPMAAASTTKDA